MSNMLNTQLEASEALTAILEQESFIGLSPDLQNKIIETVHNDIEKGGGFMGKFLGTKATNVSMHIGFIICTLLILIIIIDCIHSYCIGNSLNMDLISNILPVITLSLGYIFGKGTT